MTNDLRLAFLTVAGRDLMRVEWCMKEQGKKKNVSETDGVCVMYAGKVRWEQQQPPGLHGTAPVLSVPDLDRDTVKDLALVASDNTQVNMASNLGPNASGKTK